MPREFEFEGILFPTLLLVLVLAAAFFWLLDGLLARVGIYRHVWHAPLFRVCLFVCVFGVMGMIVYP